jgi:hypothetical protein
LLDADADRADLELRLIKLTLKDGARVHPFAGNGSSWRESDVRSNPDVSYAPAAALGIDAGGKATGPLRVSLGTSDLDKAKQRLTDWFILNPAAEACLPSFHRGGNRP